MDWQGKPNSWVYLPVRTGDWKLFADEKRERVELYNISKDRFELDSLADSILDKHDELLYLFFYRSRFGYLVISFHHSDFGFRWEIIG